MTNPHKTPASMPIETRNDEAGFVEFINSDVPYIVRDVAWSVSILLDMETRNVIGYRVYGPPRPSIEAETVKPVAWQYRYRMWNTGDWSAWSVPVLDKSDNNPDWEWRPLTPPQPIESGGWLDIKSAPKDRFILLSCNEDQSIWFAKWQDDVWHGIDEFGLTREGHSAGDATFVTGWFVELWQPLPASKALAANAGGTR